MNEKEDVRAATWRPSSWVRALMMSSVMPSAKNSFSGSALMLANGRTAIEGVASVAWATPLAPLSKARLIARNSESRSATV